MDRVSCMDNGCKTPRGSSCHCAACHQTFASLSVFDKHQTVYLNSRPAIECDSPEKMGLVLDAWGTWRTPENLLTTAKRVAAMNTSRFEKRKD